MRKLGLIGHPLKHSFSKKYFTQKFEKEGRSNCQYELFDIEEIGKIRKVLEENPELEGLNVTIPYKEQVIPFLDDMEPGCQAIGAVNTLKIKNGKLTGYNTDYIGFKESLVRWLGTRQIKAMVLGSGGASRAVNQALRDLNIPYLMVSRNKAKSFDSVQYQDLAIQSYLMEEYQLIINTTPLGTFPNTDEMPNIPCHLINSHHMVYDLVYNPERTKLMQSAEAMGATTKNGLEMLYLQAEASWEIWNRD
jgi:shikimate dehydrogenase